jgi:hypothetical protein
VAVEDYEHLVLTFRVRGGSGGASAILAGLALPKLEGKELAVPGAGEPVTLDSRLELERHWPAGADRRWIRIGGLRIDLPEEATLRWPVYPFNPYAIDDASPPEKAVGAVWFPLTATAPARTVRLTVTDPAG